MSELVVVPCTIERAKAVVTAWHRHHGASTSALFAVACADPSGVVHGVAMVGRPVARMLDDGWTLEVTRVATDGHPNACSCLYGAAKRTAVALGYSSLVTYTREDEAGASLRGAGWQDEGPIRARSWNMPNRPRTDKTEIVKRRRWRQLVKGRSPMTLEWPEAIAPQRETLFDYVGSHA